MEASRDGERACIACRGRMQSIGVERFRVGGTSGGWKLLFGEWAEMGETSSRSRSSPAPSVGGPNSECRQAAPKRHYTERRMGRARG